MHEPELYHRVHKRLKSVAGQIIKEYFNNVKWRADGCDSLMDIGSGPGDLLMNYIRPLVPENFKKIIWSDISEGMLEFFRKYYGNPNKIECRVLDITTSLGMPNDLAGKIDHITSVYCLHMVPDMKMALQNIYNLLRSDGGDCLLLFMAHTTILEAYDCLKNSPKWLSIKDDIENLIPAIYHSKSPKDEIEMLLGSTGFSDISIERKSELCSHESYENYRDNIKSICPILKCLPTESRKSEFLDELLLTITELLSKTENVQEMESKYCVRYDFLVVNAKRI